MRACACPHGFPLCACHEGLTGPALLDRSRWLSSLAGWPGAIDAAALAEHERCVEAARAGPSVPVAAQSARIAAVKACPHWSRAGCGCSGGVCSAGKGHPTTGEVGYGECFECLGV